MLYNLYCQVVVVLNKGTYNACKLVVDDEYNNCNMHSVGELPMIWEGHWAAL